MGYKIMQTCFDSNTPFGGHKLREVLSRRTLVAIVSARVCALKGRRRVGAHASDRPDRGQFKQKFAVETQLARPGFELGMYLNALLWGPFEGAREFTRLEHQTR